MDTLVKNPLKFNSFRANDIDKIMEYDIITNDRFCMIGKGMLSLGKFY